MSMPKRGQFKCRCGREVGRPEVVSGQLLCPECAFDEQYREVVRGKPPVRPAFTVRRIG